MDFLKTAFHTSVELCLYDFPHPSEIPPSEARIEVEHIILDGTSPNRHLISEVQGESLTTRRFERGEKCFVALENGKAVSYIWGTRGVVGVEEINQAVKPEAKEIYLYEAFTLEPWRGRNLYPRRSEARARIRREAGPYAFSHLRGGEEYPLEARRGQGRLHPVSDALLQPVARIHPLAPLRTSGRPLPGHVRRAGSIRVAEKINSRPWTRWMRRNPDVAKLMLLVAVRSLHVARGVLRLRERVARVDGPLLPRRIPFTTPSGMPRGGGISVQASCISTPCAMRTARS